MPAALHGFPRGRVSYINVVHSHFLNFRLAGALSGRLGNMVDLLLPDFDDAPALALRHAYAECLVAAVREAQEEAEEAAAGAHCCCWARAVQCALVL